MVDGINNEDVDSMNNEADGDVNIMDDGDNVNMNVSANMIKNACEVEEGKNLIVEDVEEDGLNDDMNECGRQIIIGHDNMSSSRWRR